MTKTLSCNLANLLIKYFENAKRKEKVLCSMATDTFTIIAYKKVTAKKFKHFHKKYKNR